MPAAIAREAPLTVDQATGEEGLLVPASDDLLVDTPVSPRVNSVKNDDPACLELVLQ